MNMANLVREDYRQNGYLTLWSRRWIQDQILQPHWPMVYNDASDEELLERLNERVAQDIASRLVR